jgi:hypothetical protein
LVSAFGPLAAVRAVILSEHPEAGEVGSPVIAVTPGTKLSKLRQLADTATADLVCVCDPDLTVESAACRDVLRVAAEEVNAGREVVAFGVVEGRDDGTLLSQVIAVDKWLSHCVLRKFLWALRVGLTLPGQFLLDSPGLLRKLAPGVDSYLDDLYLGWLARANRACVHRVPVVVGSEDPRSGWRSLLAQRVRWMRGLASLFGHLRASPAAVGLLATHYLAYHALPVFWMAGVMALAVANPVAALGVFAFSAAVLARVSRRPFLAAVGFLTVFPTVHLLASLLWWMPASRASLTRR